MKRGKIWKLVILIALISTFFIIVSTGFLYYDALGLPQGLSLASALQNWAESLLFNPILTIEDIITSSDLKEFVSHNYFLIFLYAISMILIPLIDIIIIFSVLDSFLHIFVGAFYIKDERVLVIGYNDSIKNLLRVKSKESKIYLCTDEDLTTDEERQLYLKKITVIKTDYLSRESKDDYSNRKKQFNAILKKYKINNVLLFNDSDVINMQYYMEISNCDYCKNNKIKFYVNSYAQKNKKALENYFNEMLPLDETNSRNIPKIDLRIINIAQIQAEQLFEEQPINGINDKKDVHILIIGGGDLGRELALHAMNQSVLTSNNDIQIDIVDSDISGIRSHFAEHFNNGYVENINENEFRIDSNKSDGNLSICLYNANIYDDSFAEIVKNKNYGNILVTLPDLEDNIHCALSLEDNYNNKSNSLYAFRMAKSEEMQDYLAKKLECPKENISLIGSEKEYIGLDDIINSDEETKIRRYHSEYTKFSENLTDIGNTVLDDVWYKQKYYKRQSNRALYFHHKVKNELIKEIKYMSRNKKDKTIETFFEGYKSDARTWSESLLEKENGKYIYPELIDFAKTEHRRFNYYYASEGWGYTTGEKQELERLHDCLCTWDQLVKSENTRDNVIYDLITVRIENE